MRRLYCTNCKSKCRLRLFPTIGRLDKLNTVASQENRMDRRHWHENIDPDELSRLHDRAHARAVRLRAATIDDFWRRVGSLLRRRHDSEGAARGTPPPRRDDRLGGAHC
jgi:hypothetical protein